jgi:hypothetical protein
LPANFADANRAFDERIRACFPVGSSESLLRDELRAEHFKITAVTPSRSSGYQFSAEHGGSIIPACDLEWTVYWDADDGRIVRIAVAVASCYTRRLRGSLRIQIRGRGCPDHGHIGGFS